MNEQDTSNNNMLEEMWAHFFSSHLDSAGTWNCKKPIETTETINDNVCLVW